MLMAFEIPITEPTKTFFDKITKAVIKNNGIILGDEQQGNIKITSPFGMIQATYKVDGQKVIVEILKKPIFLSEELIKNEIIKFLQ